MFGQVWPNLGQFWPHRTVSRDMLGRIVTVLERIGTTTPTEVGLGWIGIVSPPRLASGESEPHILPRLARAIRNESPTQTWPRAGHGYVGRLVLGESWLRRALGLERVVTASGESWLTSLMPCLVCHAFEGTQRLARPKKDADRRQEKMIASQMNQWLLGSLGL
jgi:hypothetical protein